jgi:hypothetical protein
MIVHHPELFLKENASGWMQCCGGTRSEESRTERYGVEHRRSNAIMRHTVVFSKWGRQVSTYVAMPSAQVGDV